MKDQKTGVQARIEALSAEIDAIGFDLSPQTAEQLEAKKKRILEIQRIFTTDPEILAVLARAKRS